MTCFAFRLGAPAGNYIGFGLSPSATRKRGSSVDAPPAAAAAAAAAVAAAAPAGGEGTSLISSQLQSLWQGMAGGGDAAAAAAAAADDVGFVRDESAFAALAAAAVPQAMR